MIKDIGEIISEIIAGIIAVGLSIMYLVFIVMVVSGFVSLCLGAL